MSEVVLNSKNEMGIIKLPIGRWEEARKKVIVGVAEIAKQKIKFVEQEVENKTGVKNKLK